MSRRSKLVISAILAGVITLASLVIALVPLRDDPLFPWLLGLTVLAALATIGLIVLAALEKPEQAASALVRGSRNKVNIKNSSTNADVLLDGNRNRLKGDNLRQNVDRK